MHVEFEVPITWQHTSRHIIFLCQEICFIKAILRWVDHKRLIIFIGHNYLSDFLARFVVNNQHKKALCSNHTQHFLFHKWAQLEGYVWSFIRDIVFTLASYMLCISILLLKHEMTIVHIHNCQLYETIYEEI